MRFLGIGEKSGPPFARTAKGRPPPEGSLITVWYYLPVVILAQGCGREEPRPDGCPTRLIFNTGGIIFYTTSQEDYNTFKDSVNKKIKEAKEKGTIDVCRRWIEPR